MNPIRYTVVDCPLGRMLAAATARGICAVSFADDDAAASRALAAFPSAPPLRDDAGLAGAAAALLALFDGQPASRVRLDARGTPFQTRVWRALQAIPRGETRSYARLAAGIGAPPAAARAVGGACAANPVALAIPCHRAVRADGALGGYRWGLPRKRRLLAIERDAARDMAAVDAGPFPGSADAPERRSRNDRYRQPPRDAGGGAP